MVLKCYVRIWIDLLKISTYNNFTIKKQIVALWGAFDKAEMEDSKLFEPVR